MSPLKFLLVLAVICGFAWVAMQTLKALVLVGVVAVFYLCWQYRRKRKSSNRKGDSHA